MAGELGYDTGPYVAAAVFCDYVLEEGDGVTTLVRLIDTLNVDARGPEAPDELPPGMIQRTLFVLLRAGQARGNQRFRVELEKPDGTRHKSPETAINFPGGQGSGARIVMPMTIQVDSAGLYWVDVLINDRMMTKVPLEIKYGFTR